MRLLRGLAASAFLVVSAAAAQAAVSVHIDQSAQRMTVRSNGQTVGTWAVSTARIGARTPNGTYRPYMLSRNHRSSLYNWAPMPYSVFFRGNYAIHGTNQLSRLGSPASAGCIRLHPSNARTLYELVQRHGFRNVSITITGGTGRFAAAQAEQRRQRAAAAAREQQQRRAARQQARRAGAQQAAPRTRGAVQRQTRAPADTPATTYAVSPHYDLRGVSQ